jgi:hypothetical protein
MPNTLAKEFTTMQIMTTKVYLLKPQSDDHDAVRLAQDAIQLYGKQRYRDPNAIERTAWTRTDVDDDTSLFAFPNSRILIAEKRAALPKASTDNTEHVARNMEVDLDRSVGSMGHECKALWASYWMILEPEDRLEHQKEIRKWLEGSIRPEDANQIISGEIDSSLTWLRYVALNTPQLQEHIRSMRIAQYYYAEFDQINSGLFELIAAMSGKQAPSMRKFTALRRALDMKRLQLREDLRLLPRRIKNSVEEILKCWEFSQLDDSVNRLQELCSDLISDQWERKAGRSRIVSEVILVAIGLFGFLNLMVAWAVFSRQVAANPMLLVDEPALPFTARVVANLPIDSLIILSSAVGFTILLVYITFRRGYR